MTSPGSDPAGGKHLYQQLFVRLRTGILDGSYPAGTLLPTEAQLMGEHGVSRITAKRALDELALHGFVGRSRGRGTEVWPRPAGLGPLIHASIEGWAENELSIVASTRTEVVAFDYRPAGQMVAARLGIQAAHEVQHAVRVRFWKGEPFSVVSTWVPAALGRTYGRGDLGAGPLIELLERSGVRVARAEQTISAESATGAVARALRTPAGTALLKVERVAYDAAGKAVEYIEAAYRPEIYKYQMHLERVGNRKDPFRWARADEPKRP